jgi:acyl-CoA reductase-like NAD-dependent aldehyde dehydrogenase
MLDSWKERCVKRSHTFSVHPPQRIYIRILQVTGYIRKGIAEGARLVTGGPDRPEGVPQTGYFVKPTVFAGVNNQMTIAQVRSVFD